MDRMTIANPSLRLYDDKRLNIATSYIYIYILNLELLEIFSFYESFDESFNLERSIKIFVHFLDNDTHAIQNTRGSEFLHDQLIILIHTHSHTKIICRNRQLDI